MAITPLLRSSSPILNPGQQELSQAPSSGTFANIPSSAFESEAATLDADIKHYKEEIPPLVADVDAQKSLILPSEETLDSIFTLQKESDNIFELFSKYMDFEACLHYLGSEGWTIDYGHAFAESPKGERRTFENVRREVFLPSQELCLKHIRLQGFSFNVETNKLTKGSELVTFEQANVLANEVMEIQKICEKYPHFEAIKPVLKAIADIEVLVRVLMNHGYHLDQEKVYSPEKAPLCTLDELAEAWGKKRNRKIEYLKRHGFIYNEEKQLFERTDVTFKLVEVVLDFVHFEIA